MATRLTPHAASTTLQLSGLQSTVRFSCGCGFVGDLEGAESHVSATGHIVSAHGSLGPIDKTLVK